MKDEPRKPLEALGDEALEARIVAWVLGEASAFEASELEERCAGDAELKRFAERMREVHQLIEADGKRVAGDEWRLPEEKRRKVVDLLGVEPVLRLEAKKRRRFPTRIVSLAAAACLMGAFVFWGISASMGGKAMKSQAMFASYEADSSPVRGVANQPLSSIRREVDFDADVLSQPSAEPLFADAPVDQPTENGRKLAEAKTMDSFAESGATRYGLVESESLVREELAQSGPVADPASVPEFRDSPVLGRLFGAEEEPSGGDRSQVIDRVNVGSAWGSSNRSEGMVDQKANDVVAGGLLDRNSDSSSAKSEEAAALWFGSNRDRAADAVISGGSAGGGAGGESLSLFLSGGDAGQLSYGYADASNGVVEQDMNSLDALASVDDPLRSNDAGVTSGKLQKLGDVRREIYDAEGALELGKFDQAKEKYEEVVRADPSNTAARRGLERVNAATTDFDRAAYDQSRAELLAEVDEAWEMTVPPGSSIAGRKTQLEGEVHVGENHQNEFRFLAEGNKMPIDTSEDSLAAAEERLRRVKREVGAPAIQAAKHPRSSDASERELAELRDAVQKQEDSVEDKRKTLTTIIRNQELIHRGLNQGGGREGGLSSDDEARMAALSFAELTEQKIKLDSQIETLLKYDDDQLMTYASGLQLPENIVRELQPQYLESKRDLDVMRLGGLGDDHPSVIRQKNVVDGMKGEIDQSIESLRENLLAQRELAVEQTSRLAEQMAEKKGKAVQQGIGLHGFDDAKQEFETSQKLLEQLKIKLAIVEGKSVSRQDPAKIEISKPGKDNTATLDAMAEISAADEAFSTFSMHVSDASFKLAAAAIERGEVPAAESVRPEEFYNAFDYGDPAPTANEPVACAVEQCAHPAFPQRNLLRIAVRTGSEGRAQSKPLNLTLLLDNSGSMEREDRALGLNRAVEGLTSLLKEGDTITVAGFSRQPRLLADRVDGKDAASLNGLVNQTPAEGGTNLEEALKLGGDLAKRQFKEGAQNRVVLFTDGAANLGDADPESLNGKVEQLRNEGIAFDAAGFGADGLNDRLLERLTRNGNGRYYVVDDAADADTGFAKQLAGAFRPAAENVKVQVVFNPSRVGNYKLIGFEEHRLKKEDFRNDAVDAAEMASEEAGVALYQFEVLPEGQGEVGEVSIRFRDTATGEMVEQSWPIPYDPQAPSFDQAKPGIQLAGIAAFVAEKLRGAPMSEAVDYAELRGVMARVKAEYDGNERVGQLEQMMRR